MVDTCFFYYIEQFITFSSSQSVKHLKFSTVLLFGFSIGLIIILKRPGFACMLHATINQFLNGFKTCFFFLLKTFIGRRHEVGVKKYSL